MIQLVYASAAAAPLSSSALETLLIKARARNAALDVTGILLHVDGSFLQVLEGRPEAVLALFAKIKQDRRHGRVLTLLIREITQRNFGDWSMAFVDASGRATQIAGYRRSRGFADLLGDAANIARILDEFRVGRWRALAS